MDGGKGEGGKGKRKRVSVYLPYTSVSSHFLRFERGMSAIIFRFEILSLSLSLFLFESLEAECDWMDTRDKTT